MSYQRQQQQQRQRFHRCDDYPEQVIERKVEASLRALSADKSREYYQATELIPNRVRTETRAVDFWHACAGNAVAAAERLAQYWKTRAWLFGDRWLLAMSQNGSGVLNAAQVEILRSGYIQVVTSAKHGTMLVTDFTLLPAGTKRLQPQIIFYLFSILACPALTLLFVVRTGHRPETVLSSNVKLTLLNCTATVVRQFFIAQAHEGPGKEHVLDYYGFQDRVLTERTFQLPCAGHVAQRSVRDTVAQLLAAGFERECLPVTLGGTLDHRSSFDAWIRMRTSVEDVLGGFGTSTVWLTSSSLPSASARGMSVHVTAGTYQTTSSATANAVVAAPPRKRTQRVRESLSLVRQPHETEKAFAKRKNALYVRRNYHRQKLEIKAAEGQVEKALRWKAQLQTENDRLRALLRQAWNCVEWALDGDFPAEN